MAYKEDNEIMAAYLDAMRDDTEFCCFVMGIVGLILKPSLRNQKHLKSLNALDTDLESQLVELKSVHEFLKIHNEKVLDVKRKLDGLEQHVESEINKTLDTQRHVAAIQDALKR